MRTNLTYAIRNIIRNKTNSIITITGLSVAIACCLLIYFFVSQEFGFNSFHTNLDRIYRMNSEAEYVDFSFKDVRFEPELAKRIREEVPQVEKCTEYRFTFEQLLKFEEDYFNPDMAYTEPDFFDIFSFPFIAGEKTNIFENPDEIVITKEFADKLLKARGDYNSLLGETIEFPLEYEGKRFMITGILDNFPKNSGIRFDGVIPGKGNRNNFGGCDWDFGYTSIYYLVKENTSPQEAEANINQLFNDYYADRVQASKEANMLADKEDAFRTFALPFSRVYLENDVFTCCETTSSKRRSVILISIGILILVIACSNYTILSLGQYMKKIGEVGIRKSMGANWQNVFSIFFSESSVLTFSSFILGILLCTLLIPVFNSLSESEIHTELISIPKVVFFVFCSFLSIVVLTSIIPVFIFSKVSPNRMGTKKINIGKQSYLSQVFVSVQYSLSIILIIVTVFIVRQADHLKNISLGVNTEDIIDIEIGKLEFEEKRILRERLLEHPGVLDITLGSRNFMNGSSNSFVNKGDGEQILTNRFKVDHRYIPTLGLSLINGKNFTEDNIRPGDRKMIVNKKFVELMAIKEDPIGKTYRINDNHMTIIGVVDDYHFQDMRQKIDPAMLFTSTSWGNGYYRAMVKFHPDLTADVISHIEKTYRKVAPGKELEYSFWDEELGKRYAEEERWSKIIGYAAIIAILISTLGLFGLTILLINQRIKEIGIRKVNGAMVIEVLTAINKSFIIWLFGSLLVASPVAYYIVYKWLEDFAYKIHISWWVFIISGLTALILAVLTVSWQSWKAASRNPVEALRYE